MTQRLEKSKLLKRISASHRSHNAKTSSKSHFSQIFFPTRSKIKLHQSNSTQIQSSNNPSLPVPLNDQVVRLNQRAVDVRLGIEQSISSLQTQRLQHLTSLNEKTRELERAAAAFEYSSSKHLKQELNKTKQMSYLFKIAILFCLTIVSFLLAYTIVQFLYARKSS